MTTMLMVMMMMMIWWWCGERQRKKPHGKESNAERISLRHTANPLNLWSLLIYISFIFEISLAHYSLLWHFCQLFLRLIAILLASYWWTHTYSEQNTKDVHINSVNSVKLHKHFEKSGKCVRFFLFKITHRVGSIWVFAYFFTRK